MESKTKGKRSEVLLRTNANELTVPVKATVYGQFAVHAAYPGDRQTGWKVSHILTGMAAGSFAYRRDAVRLAQLLDTLDFSRVSLSPAGRLLDPGGVVRLAGPAVRDIVRHSDWSRLEKIAADREKLA